MDTRGQIRNARPDVKPDGIWGGGASYPENRRSPLSERIPMELLCVVLMIFILVSFVF